MPPKKTESKAEGAAPAAAAAAPKPKSSGSQHTYQVRTHGMPSDFRVSLVI